MRVNSRLDIIEKRLVSLKTQQKLFKTKQKKNVFNEIKICELWENFKQPNVCVTGVPRGEKKDGTLKKKKLEELRTKIF